MSTRSTFHLFKIFLLTIVLWLTGIVTAFSQEYIFNTEIINVEDGLPHRMVYYIAQDKEGFIWVNTQGAISRYDGYKFKTYNASFLTIADGGIAFMAIDADNRLWYCEEGFNGTSGVIDTAKDSLYSMESISKGLFSSKDVIYLSNVSAESDDILIMTRSGIVYKYNGHFEEIFRLQIPVVSSIFLCKAAPDGSYWILYHDDLFRVKNNKVLQTIKVDMGMRRIFSTTPELIAEIIHPPPYKYWKLEKDTLVPFTIAPHAPEEIRALLQFHKDYTCYATKDALLIRDTTGKLIYRFDDLNTPGQSRKLVSHDVLMDHRGILWVATQNGLLKLTVKKTPFEIVFPGNSMRGIFKDKDSVWVGGGDTTEAPDHVKTEQEYLSKKGNDAMSFYKDLRGHLWIGTQYSNIVEYLPATGTYIHYDFDTQGYAFQLPFQNPRTQNYFIGTNNGLFRFNTITKKASPFPLPIASRGVNIRQAYQNKQGIWLVSSKGIFLMDAEKETIVKHYTTADGLPTNSILHIHEDKDGIFWLGTRDAGLVRWERENNSFRQYTREDELSNNKIYAVYEDEYQTLWLPSDYGLMAFDKNTEITRVYLPKDGTAHEEFNYFSHFQDTDGTLYFGGLNGITKFHPATLREDSNTEIPLYTTRVRVLEKDAETYTDKTPVFKTAKKIVLSPNDRILEVALTLLDYERTGENQYAYKLEGKQEQWIYTRENTLSIINPPYGKYTMVIKARGASGSWSKQPLVIPMHVKAPFYMQWWFILTAITVIITSILIGVRWRVQKLKKDRKHLEAEVQKRTRQIEKDKQTIEQQAEGLKVLDRAKTRFFANITHEFRTPLTLVAGPIEQLIEKPPPPAALKQKLSGVLKNTRNLMQLINQLLDLSKLEGGRMNVEISHGDIVRYTRELVSRFQPLADKKQLQLEFTTATDMWKIHTDIDKWTKIVHNLLSNAIKFTAAGGRVTAGLEAVTWNEQQCIELRVNDTGIGIAAESMTHIFNRFYQADASSTRLQGGTGIGLSLVKELVELQNGKITVDSILGKGSVFTVTLPLLTAPETGNTIPMPAPETLLAPLETAEAVSENEYATADITETHGEKLELLIIEDNAEMRSYIRSCIDTSFYTVSEAANGAEGIEKALETVPDLIISDVMMPEKNGFEVTEAIRGHIATSHIPLILLTAKASLESRLKGLERGADAYLTKPFSPEELALRIKKLIELRKLLQQRYQNRDRPPEENTEFEKEDGFISELKGYILDNISEPELHVDTISRHFAISRIQLYRKLRALINKPIGDYIRSIRLETALKLLKEEQLNITEIAYEIGFSSVSNFSKAFKKVYGKTPSEIK